MAQTILVVDDDQDLVYIITEFLKKHGYEILIAPDGQQALDLIKTTLPDLIIADLTMPNMGGWHFTQKVREDKRCAHIPIIVLSGLLESDSEPETFEAANAYMGKPFEVFKLLEKVQTLLIKPQ
ncbi:MAG: response regulator [Candidatus Omnitrophica bacterium]|nr:response regulator [Candidatus Omnitrophota bacterium]